MSTMYEVKYVHLINKVLVFAWPTNSSITLRSYLDIEPKRLKATPKYMTINFDKTGWQT